MDFILFQKIRKYYYFIYYCNYKVMDSIADKYMKAAPYNVHGWTWPMFIFILNLMTIDSLMSTTIFKPENTTYFWMSYCGIALLNFFIFTYKKRHIKIVEECSRLPFRIRRFGVTFFAVYSIASFVILFVVIFADWHV